MPDSELVSFGPYTLNAAARMLQRDGEVVPLGSRALDLLITLVERAGEVVPHRDLVARAWLGLTVEPGNLRVAIACLRKALGDRSGGEPYIVNVPGRGYCFVGSLARRDSGPGGTSATGGATRLSSPPPKSLPAVLAHVVGRADAIGELQDLLRQRRFVSIVGSGGMGKTTVAVAAAHAMADSFGGAVYFVDLGLLTDPALVAATVASAVGVSVTTEDPVPGLLALIAERPVLIILDSCEHLIDAAAALAERLFLEAPSAAILATSREALRVEGEHVYLLQPLAAPPDLPELSAAEAMAAPAVQLLMGRAFASGRQALLVDAEVPIVAEICHRLDGIALAIELAGSQVAAYGVRGAADLLNSRFRLLWQGRRSALPRHRTLQAMLDWSHNLLSDAERTVLARLSVFVGFFTLDGARIVAADHDLDAVAVTTAVSSLIEKCLVNSTEVAGVAQLRLQDTTRAYAAVKLAERSEADAVARRHAAYHADALQVLRTTGDAAMSPADVAGLAHQTGNVRAALVWCFSPSGDRDIGCQLAASASKLFLALSLLTECDHWCGLALATEPSDSRLQLDLREGLAISAMYTRGNPTFVRTAIEQALKEAETLGERQRALNLLAGLHMYLGLRGDFLPAVEVSERTMKLATEVGAPPGVVLAEWMFAAAYQFLGDQAATLRHCEAGMRLSAPLRTAKVEFFGYDHRIRTLIILARAQWLTGNPDRAARYGWQAIEEARDRPNPIDRCVAKLSAATVLLWRGDLDAAEAELTHIHEYAERRSLGPFVACALGLLGELAILRGDPQTGVTIIREALAAMDVGQFYTFLTRFQCDLAEGLLGGGDALQAEAAIGAAIARAETQGGSCDMPELLRVQTKIGLAAQRIDAAAAEHALQRSMHVARAQSSLSFELRAACSLARLQAAQGRIDEAHALLSSCYGRFTEGFDTTDLRAARGLLASLRPGPGVRRSGRSAADGRGAASGAF